MKTYVKTDYIPNDCDYLTVGKEYELMEINMEGWSKHEIIADDGDACTICPECCAHLDDRPWILINR